MPYSGDTPYYESGDIDPVTLRLAVQNVTDFGVVILEGDIEIPAAATGVATPAIDTRSDKDKTILIKTGVDMTAYVQFAYDDRVMDDAPIGEWFTLADADGAAKSFTVNDTNLAIPISCKGRYMRIVLDNNGIADSPYLVVA